MSWLKIKNLMLVLLSTLLMACGAAENTGSTYSVTSANNTTMHAYLQAHPGIFMAFDRSSEDQNRLVQVQRTIPYNYFDALIEPDQNMEKTVINSVITGIAIEAVNHDGEPLEITLGVIGREYNTKTGSFSNETRLFSSKTGESFRNAQSFYIGNTDSPNFLLAGLGLHIREGRITKLAIQRKSISELYNRGKTIGVGSESGGAVVSLDNGFAATGFHIRIKAADSNDRVPFVQDLLFYPAQLTEK
jgi:hypothetical protein